MDFFHQKIQIYLLILLNIYLIGMISKHQNYFPKKSDLINLINFSYMLLADYAEYIKAQDRVDQLYKVKSPKNANFYLFHFFKESN
jgi:hypothetical protein